MDRLRAGLVVVALAGAVPTAAFAQNVPIPGADLRPNENVYEFDLAYTHVFTVQGVSVDADSLGPFVQGLWVLSERVGLNVEAFYMFSLQNTSAYGLGTGVDLVFQVVEPDSGGRIPAVSVFVGGGIQYLDNTVASQTVGFAEFGGQIQLELSPEANFQPYFGVLVAFASGSSAVGTTFGGKFEFKINKQFRLELALLPSYDITNEAFGISVLIGFAVRPSAS
jgi:hypothetical protein